LALGINQIDDRNLRTAQRGSQFDNIVEITLPGRIQDLIALQRVQAIGLVRVRRRLHVSSSLAAGRNRPAGITTGFGKMRITTGQPTGIAAALTRRFRKGFTKSLRGENRAAG
jgi:hypothetical protein